ncbi:cupin domain-containing protein [Rhodospirillaceae bacterium SYSU D60014]|uniref:cupin domain-containing protein n=1 Tax=Virgifigura deserti TaxID=2268457 RepID=UPI0013C44FA4
MADRSNLKAALEQLYADVHSGNMFPFWATTTDVPNDEIRQLMQSRRAIPFVWSYDALIGPLLKRSADLISTADSERRSLILINPGLAPTRATVSTMYSSYRLNDPNEVMPPHRHSPNAIRFGLTGHQNFTGVEGEDIVFGPGDMVLTPHDTWHNHGNKGGEPAVNLSVLDLPLVEVLNAIYFEHDYKEKEGDALVKKKEQSARFTSDYSQRVYGRGGYMPRFVSHDRGTGAASPMYVYRWEPMREFLEEHKDWDGDPYDGLKIEYIDPTNGQPIFKTMTFFAQMLRAGEKTLPLKQTASLLVTPFEGPKGYSLVDGQRHEWGLFDTLAVPGGSWCQHVNDTSESVILFVASDEPALTKLGLFKRWGQTRDGDTIRLD